jgi:Predicted lipoprotein involved in nitrous oxide reduction
MTLRVTGMSALLLLLAACSPGVVPQAIEPTDAATCSLDDMLLADFPGPKGQIVYEHGTPDFFCDTVEMIATYLQPEQQKRVVAIYTQDMGQAAWEKPRGHWIDAKSAFYVIGSRKTGSMGPTLGTFLRESDAQAFAQANGGQVLRFDRITPDMVSLDGGVMKDGKM